MSHQPKTGSFIFEKKDASKRKKTLSINYLPAKGNIISRKMSIFVDVVNINIKLIVKIKY